MGSTCLSTVDYKMGKDYGRQLVYRGKKRKGSVLPRINRNERKERIKSKIKKVWCVERIDQREITDIKPGNKNTQKHK